MFIKVIWQRLFSNKSGSEKGTMYQFRNLLNRTSVPLLDPGKNMKAAEDFLLLLLHAHVVVAAKKLLSYELTDSSVFFVAKSIVNTHLLLPGSEDEIGEKKDGINMYARELLTLSLLWHYFHDSSKEGDGQRIFLSWKILLSVFKATNHRNYAKEAVLLLLQYNYFSERMKSQLLWSRCINTKGRIGTNIPCDLHLEHLNRRLKTILRSMGANISPESIVRAGKSILTVHNVCIQFEEETRSSSCTRSAHSDVHNTPSFGKDFKEVLKVLVNENVMEPQHSRFHPSFTFEKGLLQQYSRKELLKRIETTIKGTIM